MLNQCIAVSLYRAVDAVEPCPAASASGVRSMTPSLGFIGAGQLGEPMVYRLIAAGNRVRVCARRPELRDRLSRVGADVTDSIESLASSSDIVISCLFSDEQLHEVVSGPDGLVANAKPGMVFVSHTTGSVGVMEALAADGLTVVDAPVSGTAEDISQGRLTVLIGGPTEAVGVVRPLLASYAEQILHTGDLGTALTLKLVNNALFAANVQLVAAAMRVVEGLGGDSTRLLKALEYCSGGSRASAGVAAAPDLDAFVAGAGPFLRKDVAAYVDAAKEAGLDPGLLETAIRQGYLRFTTG